MDAEGNANGGGTAVNVEGQSNSKGKGKPRAHKSVGAGNKLKLKPKVSASSRASNYKITHTTKAGPKLQVAQKSKRPKTARQCLTPVWEKSSPKTSKVSTKARYYSPPSTSRDVGKHEALKYAIHSNPTKKIIPAALGRNPDEYEGKEVKHGNIPPPKASQEIKKKPRCTPSIAKLEAKARSQNVKSKKTEGNRYKDQEVGGPKAPESMLSPILPLPGDDSMYLRKFITTYNDERDFADQTMQVPPGPENNNLEEKADENEIWKTQKVLYVPESPTSSQETELYTYSPQKNPASLNAPGMYSLSYNTFSHQPQSQFNS